jgi:methylenetetrahydrofolate dehydrogenase (NADP+)/methenyltetrahydrofolate cyclohydrolase
MKKFIFNVYGGMGEFPSIYARACIEAGKPVSPKTGQPVSLLFGPEQIINTAMRHCSVAPEGMGLVARIIRGMEIGAHIRAELASDIRELKGKRTIPGLSVILVGEDPASVSYVLGKAKACRELGILEETFRLPAGTDERSVLELVDRLNAEPRFHGILVQLPLPGHIDPDRVILRVDPDKDVDGLHPVNLGRLMSGNPILLPCTPAGIHQILVRSGFDPSGKHVVVCGRSVLVGKPLANMLLQKRPGANATVTVCHTGTRDMGELTRQADILIAAMGSPKAITAEMVKQGAVVIDVGVNRVEDAGAPKGFRLVGDVDFDAVKEKAAAITPVPGGVGPMTITMLMANTVRAARNASIIKG